MENYLEINKTSWNAKVDTHVKSDFYFVDEFLKGRNSLNSIELDLLGDVKGKSILHLQCHFGQDSISLSRLGAKVTGVDLSDKAIETARDLTKQCETDTNLFVRMYMICQMFWMKNLISCIQVTERWAGFRI